MAWPSDASDAHAILTSPVGALLPKLVDIRHDLHRQPELGFEERRTQGIVREWLTQHGYAPQSVAETGIVADLRPDLVGRKPTIALRADLDALPVHEDDTLAHSSQHPGVAHKCGHDGHTAILLGVAAALAQSREQAPANVRLLFQPAEEGVRGGGARPMVAAGVLDDVAEVYALHNWPAFDHRRVHVKAGVVMAANHRIEIHIQGEGAHASAPEAARDPVAACAQLITQLYAASARHLGAHGGAVLSLCVVQAGEANNVIPATAHVGGSLRSWSTAQGDRMIALIRDVSRGIEMSFNVSVNVNIEAGYPVLDNNEPCAAAVARVANRYLGAGTATDEGLPLAASEDFAYFAQDRPAAYFFLGAGDPGRTTPGCHHPAYDFRDDLIADGIALFLGLCHDRLAGPNRIGSGGE